MQSTRHTLIIERLAGIRGDLDQIVDRISPDLLGWVPAEGMRSFSGQLAEIISVEIPLVPWLKDGKRLSDAAVDEMMGDLGNLDNLRRLLVDVRRETLDYLNSLSEKELLEEVSIGDAWFGALWLPKLPRAEIFLNIAEHELYHVGQLTAYLWSRGDNPYNW